MFNFVYYIQCGIFDSHLDYSQQSLLKGEFLVFFFFHMVYLPSGVWGTPLIIVMRSITSVTPFWLWLCGYAVSHFGDPFLVMDMWLCG